MGRDGVGVVIPAAGRGERLKSRLHKPFVPLANRPLISHTLAAFQRVSAVSAIVLVARPEDHLRLQQLVRRTRLTKVRAIVAGGPSRAASVSRGVAALPAGLRWILVHDAARPCVTPTLITAVIQHAKRHGAVACGLRSSVTVKAVDDQDRVRLTLDRESLWLIQTPQAFCREWFAEALSRLNGHAYRQAGTLDQFPDDAAILEWAGYPVRMIKGDPLNIKVTTPEDLRLASAILSKYKPSRC